MGLPSQSAELGAVRQALEGLGARLAQHRQEQEARRAAMADQLQALVPLLPPVDSVDLRQQQLSRLRQALEPDQTIDGWLDEVYGSKLEALVAAEPGWVEQVEFTLVRCPDRDTAEALLPALSDGELPPQAGLVGPRRLRSLNVHLQAALEPLQPGEVQGPLAIGPWWLLLRLEQRRAATLTAELRQALVEEMLDEDFTTIQAGEAPHHAPELAALLTL